MAEQIGMAIKKARLDAGMTQAKLAEGVEGMSARDISKAERGLIELSDDELAAIAEALGTDADSLLAAAEDSSATTDEEAVSNVEEEVSPDAAEMPAPTQEELMSLFESADPNVKGAILSMLKGEAPEKGVLDTVLPVIGEVLASKQTGVSPAATLLGFLGSEDGKGLVDKLKVTATSMFQSASAAKDGDEVRKAAPGSLLTFTYLYASTIYVLLLSFYFWQLRTDIQPRKREASQS